MLALLLVGALVWILNGTERASGDSARPTVDATPPPSDRGLPRAPSRIADPDAPVPLVFDDDLPDEPFEPPPPVPSEVGSIEGTVRLNGELEDAVVWCTPRGAWERQVAQARDGVFRFEEVPVGTVDIEAAPAEWAREAGQLLIVGALKPVAVRADETANVELFLDAPERAFEGTVRHASGAPAVGWQVFVSATRGPLSFRARTDERGRFSCSVPDVGLPYRAEVHSIGATSAEASPGEYVELELPDLVELVVRATDVETGETLTAFEVDLRLPESQWQRPPRPEHPDADGAFRWKTFAGVFDVLVLAPGFATAEVLDVELDPGGSNVLDVRLERH